MENESDKEMQDEEEMQNEIKLTPEFLSSHAQPCSIIELISLFKNDEKNGLKPFDDNPVVKATKDYLIKFNKYGISESVANKAYTTRRIFRTKEDQFSSLEQTSLVDLAPSNVDEAKHLIPTLKDKKDLSDEEFQSLLDTLNKEIQ